MILKGIDFGNVLGASGVQGFFGEGYRFHTMWKFLGMNLHNMTFVSKTATLHKREGNMALRTDFTPEELFPNCVTAKPLRGVMLNAVGLSNPGLEALLDRNEWQGRNEPFLISLMPMADSSEGRLDEMKQMIHMISLRASSFRAQFGLQINFSCPNTKHKPASLVKESASIIEAAAVLGVPIMPKYGITSTPFEAIMELEKHPSCDAICVSNTFPYDWNMFGEAIWGKSESPLVKFNYQSGGISGSLLLPWVTDWIRTLRKMGFTKPINGGGGIMTKQDVKHYYDAGASSVFLGSVVPLRPWRVRGIIQYTNSLNWEGR